MTLFAPGGRNSSLTTGRRQAKSDRHSRRRNGDRPRPAPCGVESLESRVLLSTVNGRFIFYNNSAFDDGQSGDDGAIATDKSALLPGNTATFANYASYSKGINGIMVDIAGLPGTGSNGPTASDFVFKVGNAADGPAVWTTAPAPASITTRRGMGARTA